MERLAENPLITPGDLKPSRPDFEVVGTFNAGVTRFGEEVILLLRVAERPREESKTTVASPVWRAERGKIEVLRIRRDDPELREEDARLFRYRGNFYLTSISHLRLARSRDGIHFKVEEKPALLPEIALESYGLEDPRITRMGDDYWITYKAVSKHGVTTALAHTRDFVTYRGHGILFSPENLDVVIFPEQVRSHYLAWTRPVGEYMGPPAIWSARSPNLLHWGEHQPALLPRPGRWDSSRIGSGAVPFLTPRGWIEIYHGADHHSRYSLGAVLMETSDPSRILGRSERPLLEPERKYEPGGFFGNVVFSCGADVTPEGKVTVYYGASDQYTCAATTTVDEILTGLSTEGQRQ